MDTIQETNTVVACPWLGNRTWAYSITFDEALSELHRFAVPILERYNVPGHVEVVVGQMGKVRQLFESSYNDMRHMGPKELRELLARGWGVGSHSWSHTWINAANAELELGRSKQVLEEAIGQPVTIYCAPGSNLNMSPVVLEACRRYGYLGAMGIFEALNRPEDEDLLWLNRTFLHDQGPNEHDSEFNPFRQILHAQHDRGWIIDYLHCPLEKPVHPRKDCSADQLRQRIETVVELGGDEVWLATVDEIQDYRYTRRFLAIEPQSEGVVEISAPGLPPSVHRRTITLRLPMDVHSVEQDGRRLNIYHRAGEPLVDVEVGEKTTLHWVQEGVTHED